MEAGMKKISLFLLTFMVFLSLSACTDGSTASGPTGLGVWDMEDGGTAEPDTAEDDMSGLSAGDSIWTNGVKVTLNSIEDGPETSTGTSSYMINVTYENYGDTMNSISPFDWSTVEGDGTVVSFDMDGKGSFNLITLPSQKRFTGNVVLFKTDDSKEIQFSAITKWSDITATWTAP
jgi:hypothetical protein